MPEISQRHPYIKNSLCSSDTDIFKKVQVSPHIEGGTTISWELKSSVNFDAEYYFTVQKSRVDLPGDNSVWQDAGSSTQLGYFVDTEQTRFSMVTSLYYRIKFVNGSNTFYSHTFAPTTGWSYREYYLYRAVQRSEKVRMQARTGTPGVLFKRKWYGTACPDCTDPLTGAVSNGNCATCHGTGFVNGYFNPIYCVWSDIQPLSEREAIDMNNRGIVDDRKTVGRFFATPDLHTNDIWVNVNTSERFAIQDIKHAEEIRGIPVILQVELRLLSPTDEAYNLNYDDTEACRVYGPRCY